MFSKFHLIYWSRTHKTCIWSINQVSGIFALESHLGEVPCIMSFFLLLWIMANLSILSGQESSQVYYRRPNLQSPYYLLEIPQTPTNRFICHFLSYLCFAKLTILAGCHLSWSRRNSTDACCSTPFVRVLSLCEACCCPGGLSIEDWVFWEAWFCPEKLWWTCRCHCDYISKTGGAYFLFPVDFKLSGYFPVFFP